MGQVVSSAKFSREPVTQHPDFTARRADVCRMLSISDSTLYRWESSGTVWAYDAEDAPDGHYTTVPSGRKRYCLERMWSLHAVR